MSLKTVHFLVFLVTSLMSFVCAAITWRQYQNPEVPEGNYLALTIGFAIAGILLLGYSIWYYQHSKNVIT
jgi:CHASE2 domain-containing sensor protein